MKKIGIIFSMAFLLMTLGSFAQKSVRTSAYFYFNDGKLDKAKEAIDKAAKHPKTINDAKTWLYRGAIYYKIATSPIAAYQKLDTNAAVVALRSLEKAKKLDVKGKFKANINLNLHNLTNVFYRIGAYRFNQKNYAKSIAAFKNAFRVAVDVGQFDTVAAFNIGMSAVLDKKPNVAAKYLKECIEKHFNDPRVYLFYSRSLKQIGDTTEAMATLKEGRVRYPNNLKLLLEEAQLYLEKGDSDKLISSLKEAIAKDTGNINNANFYFLIGKSYDDAGKTDSAETYYKNAAKAKPDFFEAYYNIGAIFVNKASELQKTANDLPLDAVKKYNKINGEANDNLKKAVPWLEKSLKLHPNDIPTLKALKEAYARLKMIDKLKELKGK